MGTPSPNKNVCYGAVLFVSIEKEAASLACVCVRCAPACVCMWCAEACVHVMTMQVSLSDMSTFIFVQYMTQHVCERCV